MKGHGYSPDDHEPDAIGFQGTKDSEKVQAFDLVLIVVWPGLPSAFSRVDQEECVLNFL